MDGFFVNFARRTPAVALAAAVAISVFTGDAFARGPDNIADVAEKVIDAVVNISTSQKVEVRRGQMPQVPQDSPLDELFKEFFKNRRGQGGGGDQDSDNAPSTRRVNSLGSGFVIDAEGIVVTNNHVISEADEV